MLYATAITERSWCFRTRTRVRIPRRRPTSRPMTTTNAANNRDLALRFVEAFDSRDLQAIDHLLADDFVWHVAVVPEGVTQFRPFQSEELQGRNIPVPAVQQDNVRLWPSSESSFEMVKTQTDASAFV